MLHYYSSQIVVSEGEYGTNQMEPPKFNSRLFALIIGINKYNSRTTSNSRGQKTYSPEIELPSFTNLRGAVADAENFYKYLTSDLDVPSDRINLLCDEQATRAEIIKAFQDLGERQDIRKGDSIVIFYAGHGAQALPPQRLSATPGCPKYVELLVPHDYGKDPKNYQSKGIPDYTLAALLNGIAEKKGDNITVIFDSCHSASALRGPVSKPVSDDENSQPIARTGPELNYRIPDDLDVDIWGGKRALSVLPRLRHVGSASYVFFSACSSSELAKEDNGRGYFTSALLKLLKEVGSRTLPCSQIITRIGRIHDQILNAKDCTQLDLFFMVSCRHTGTIYNVSVRHQKH
ncbi:caspase domain-containing protein [Pholiota molesta]|nr:caspase domain-containing protein [Pholiota molesta]